MARIRLSRRSLLGLLGLALAIAIGTLVLPAGTAISDTDEDLFPDPRARTEHRMALIQEAIGQFHQQRGRYPQALHELSSSAQAAARELDRLSDGWNRPLSYTLVDTGYELRSSGADGIPGTVDDVVITISG